MCEKFNNMRWNTFCVAKVCVLCRDMMSRQRLSLRRFSRSDEKKLCLNLLLILKSQLCYWKATLRLSLCFHAATHNDSNPSRKRTGNKNHQNNPHALAHLRNPYQYKPTICRFCVKKFEYIGPWNTDLLDKINSRALYILYCQKSSFKLAYRWSLSKNIFVVLFNVILECCRFHQFFKSTYFHTFIRILLGTNVIIIYNPNFNR
jgi:hypothetical protein